MEDIGFSEWQEWLDSPVTIAFIKALRHEAESVKEYLASGGAYSPSSDETALEYARSIGYFNGLKRAIDFALEQGGKSHE